MKSHKDLTLWQKSMLLAEEVYLLTSKFPNSEKFGLSSQMQRAAVAIPSNIAEGAKRIHRQEFIHFLSIAQGSASELETQLILSKKLFKDLNVDFEKALGLTEEILKIVHKLILSLKASS